MQRRGVGPCDGADLVARVIARLACNSGALRWRKEREVTSFVQQITGIEQPHDIH